MQLSMINHSFKKKRGRSNGASPCLVLSARRRTWDPRDKITRSLHRILDYWLYRQGLDCRLPEAHFLPDLSRKILLWEFGHYQRQKALSRRLQLFLVYLRTPPNESNRVFVSLDELWLRFYLNAFPLSDLESCCTSKIKKICLSPKVQVWSSLSFQEPFKHNLSQKYPIKLGLIWALGSKSALDNWFVLA